jgi:hypothetical protein
MKRRASQTAPSSFFLGLGETESTWHDPLFNLLDQPQVMDDDDECRAVGGISATRNQSTHRIPAPVQLCLPQMSYDLTWARTQAAVVGTWQLAT